MVVLSAAAVCAVVAVSASFSQSRMLQDRTAQLRAAVESDHKVEEFVFDLGQMQLRAGDFTDALATFDRGRQRFPASAQIELAYGVAAYELLAGEKPFPAVFGHRVPLAKLGAVAPGVKLAVAVNEANKNQEVAIDWDKSPIGA